MSLSAGAYINTELESRRLKVLSIQKARQQEVYLNIPALVDIDKNINSIGINFSKFLLSRVGENPETAVSHLKSKINKLKNEKLAILKIHGYPTDYLEPPYICSTCCDTGFVGDGNPPVKCSCYKQMQIEYYFKQSNIELIDTENFERFNENYFSSSTDPSKYGIKLTPRDNIVNIKRHCMRFIDEFHCPETKNLLFCGSSGVGKTFMASCIAKELLLKEFTVLYISAPKLFETINNKRLNSFKGITDKSADFIYTADLLIIDDLGTENLTSAKYSVLLDVLNNRNITNLSNPCKIIISTNLGLKQIHESYGERISSRIIGCFDMYKFGGEDLRKVKVAVK